eukprot:g2305.t1
MLKTLDAELQKRQPRMRAMPSLRKIVEFRPSSKFDTRRLPTDLARVVGNLTRRFGEDYALHIAFTIRTAVELHRAWNMTLLTSTLMEQLKERFDLRLTWSLGVLRLKFRIEDGEYELHRKVPYDYDSEYQDKYMRIATALVDGHVDVHKALQYQMDVKRGKHTARSGLFLRLWPGRLVLYPFEAATCTVIFFGGDWGDAGVAAITGVAAGLVEWGMQNAGRLGGVCLDVTVGLSTGVIASLMYRYHDDSICLSSVFLGTLYWFFYGTAFVIGLLEIIAGELETGVTRFIAVSVKTFVLCLGASIGMLATLKDTNLHWTKQRGNCSHIDLDAQWWRVPLYLACSVSVLGQYRFPVVDYWRGLVVQLAAYEVQYQTHKALYKQADNMDYAASNMAGAAAAVVCACVLSWLVEFGIRRPYYARILHRKTHGRDSSRFDACMYRAMTCCVRFGDCLGLGRKSEVMKLKVEKKIEVAADPARPDVPAPIVLDQDEENVLVEAIVGAAPHNIWSVLMPAVYQLVPGSMIAKMWFQILLPPAEGEASVFSNLMVISASLAVGLIVGFAAVRLGDLLLHGVARWCGRSGGAEPGTPSPASRGASSPLSAAEATELGEARTHQEEMRAGARGRLMGMFTNHHAHHDPDSGGDGDDDDEACQGQEEWRRTLTQRRAGAGAVSEAEAADAAPVPRAQSERVLEGVGVHEA